jgi:beta-N-acetylhexosaminidase
VPAVNVRTARAGLLVAGALIVALVAILVSHSGGGGGGRAARSAAARAGTRSRHRLSSRPRMVGQLVMAAMHGFAPDAALLARIRAGQLGGVLLLGANVASPTQVRALVSRLQHAARAGGAPPLLIATDQEGGLVKRLPFAPPFLTPPQMGVAGAAVSQREGERTGAALRALGIDVDIAPVLDVPRSPAVAVFREGRTFGMDPRTVIASAVPFALGLQRAGVAATAKHYPGIGGGVLNTDYNVDRIDERQADLLPFKAAIDARVALIMASTAIYPSLDPQGNRAVVSPAIITGLLRGRSRYGGVIITDDLEVPSVAATGRTVVRAAAAGANMMLVTSSENGGIVAYRALLKAAASGQLPAATLRDSYRRVLALKGALARRILR